MSLFSAAFSALGAIAPALHAGEEVHAFYAAFLSEVSHGSPIGVALERACAATGTTLDDHVLAELEAGLTTALQYVEQGIGYLADAEQWLRTNGPTVKKALRASANNVETAIDVFGGLAWKATVIRPRIRAILGTP